MIGIIGKKLGMTQIFNEQGQQIPVTVVEATPNPVVKVTDEGAGWASRPWSSAMGSSARARRRRRASARRAVAARTKAELGHAEKAGLDARAARAAQLPPRRRAGEEAGDPDVQGRRHGERRHLRARRAGEGHRHVEGPRLPGRREALRHSAAVRTRTATRSTAGPAPSDPAPIRRASSRARRCRDTTAPRGTRRRNSASRRSMPSAI